MTKDERVQALAERVLAKVGREALARLAGGDVPDAGPSPLKYLDAERWIRVCARRAVALDLDRTTGLRVLDLGTGAGYFPLVCRELGHHVEATDWSQREGIYREITAAIGVWAQDVDVVPFVPLRVVTDATAHPVFDLITAYMVTFNDHASDPWGVDEWSFFLDDCMRRLMPGGRLVLEVNRELDGKCYSSKLAALFRARGAAITGPWPHLPTPGGKRLVFTRR